LFGSYVTLRLDTADAREREIAAEFDEHFFVPPDANHLLHPCRRVRAGAASAVAA